MSNEDGILIIGSGFAGVWAAAAASRVRADAGLGDRDLPITVVSDRRDLVIRPRLYEAEVRLTGEAAKALKKAICESYIYPPVHDADALMAEAGRRPHPAVLV